MQRASRPQPRRCDSCGAEMRFSHREHAGGRQSRAVLRCRGCGLTVTTAATEAEVAAGAGRSKRHRPVDEGPPQNTVLDDATARRLRQALGEADGSG